jgi:hypothetical protein
VQGNTQAGPMKPKVSGLRKPKGSSVKASSSGADRGMFRAAVLQADKVGGAADKQASRTTA